MQKDIRAKKRAIVFLVIYIIGAIVTTAIGIWLSNGPNPISDTQALIPEAILAFFVIASIVCGFKIRKYAYRIRGYCPSCEHKVEAEHWKYMVKRDVFEQNGKKRRVYVRYWCNCPKCYEHHEFEKKFRVNAGENMNAVSEKWFGKFLVDKPAKDK